LKQKLEMELVLVEDIEEKEKRSKKNESLLSQGDVICLIQGITVSSGAENPTQGKCQIWALTIRWAFV
jgi:hypothetical protein